MKAKDNEKAREEFVVLEESIRIAREEQTTKKLLTFELSENESETFRILLSLARYEVSDLMYKPSRDKVRAMIKRFDTMMEEYSQWKKTRLV
jgi:hypothetical protein